MTLAPVDYTGKSPDEIRATAVANALGPEVIDGKATAYIHARFDHLVEQAQQDPARRTLIDRAASRTH